MNAKDRQSIEFGDWILQQLNDDKLDYDFIKTQWLTPEGGELTTEDLYKKFLKAQEV
jgi:hypothetical protein